MSVQELVVELLDQLPEHRQRFVLDFVRFVAWGDEQDDWRSLAREEFSRAYADDEPEYTEGDVRSADHR